MKGEAPFRNHLLALHNFHRLGSNNLLGSLLLLLLLAGHESGGRKGEDGDLLHNDYLGFDVVSNDAWAGLPSNSAGNIPRILNIASLK